MYIHYYIIKKVDVHIQYNYSFHLSRYKNQFTESTFIIISYIGYKSFFKIRYKLTYIKNRCVLKSTHLLTYIKNRCILKSMHLLALWKLYVLIDPSRLVFTIDPCKVTLVNVLYSYYNII